MWATIKLTALGKKLVENREYRFLSPVFSLNDKGEPIDIDSIAFTNKPAFKNHIEPILNSESNEIFNKEIISMDMTKEELREMITSIISEMKEAEKTEEIKEEIKEEIVENKCSDEIKEVVANEETTEEISEEKTEVVEEKTTEEKPVEAEKEEVIKIETLNSAPTIKEVEPEWKKLKGKEFLDWASKNSHYKI
jgi:phage I-like protein